jgi:hypothetical protein
MSAGPSQWTTSGRSPYYYGQTDDRQKLEFTGRFKIRTSAMTCGY